jgi:pilus assembly protein FimV
MMSRGPYPILLMLAMSLPGAVKALGLGEIRINSALNEPLSAQIDIVGATRDELAALTAGVANREIFNHYGVDRPAFLSTATFKVGMDAQGHPVLNVRSADAFTDPVVSFLVDIRWGRNQIVREYSLLLDPPDYKYTHSASGISLASAPAVPAPVPAAPAAVPVAPAFARGAAPAEPGQGGITVAAGDTLRGVARRAGARTETQAQTLMIAIFRANPDAFDGNINRLHQGVVLTIPTPADLAAVSSADAKREVRAHMTAWRLDGRPAAVARVASAPTPVAAMPPAAAAPATTLPATTLPVTAAIDAGLKDRVQSLERQLNDLHRQLANENDTLQSLRQSTVAEPAAAAAPVPAVPPATHVTPPVAAQSPPPLVPPTTASAASHAAELVSAPIIAPETAAKVAPTVAGPSQKPTASNAEIFAPAAVTLGLLLAGFAYVRRRLLQAPQPAVASPPLPSAVPMDEPRTIDVTSAATLDEPMSSLEAFKPGHPAAAVVIAEIAEQPKPVSSSETTSNLEIDIEALERSYLESMPGESAEARQDDPALAETTTVETVAIDTEDLDTAAIDADLNTVLMDVKDLGGESEKVRVHDTALDFNLVDLDSTAQHVHMPSGLNDRPPFKERRTNIVDVLKVAIERDPNRRDLRMKLLETYYSLASANQRAFMEVVRRLAREKDLLTAEDWKKVTVMGRDIAADDILFADLDPPKDGGDLAHCA